MELVMQNKLTTCGQACIAMIANKTIEMVINDMKTDGPTSIGQLMEILDKYGIPHAERNTRISKKNPEFGLIEGEYTFGKITSFLGIFRSV